MTPIHTKQPTCRPTIRPERPYILSVRLRELLTLAQRLLLDPAGAGEVVADAGARVADGQSGALGEGQAAFVVVEVAVLDGVGGGVDGVALVEGRAVHLRVVLGEDKGRKGDEQEGECETHTEGIG